MMQGIKRRILASISGNLAVQAINTLIQLFGIPLLIKYWGIEYYGEWLILFAVPSYIAVSDMGLGTSTTAELSMMIETGRRTEASEILRYVFWFILTIGGIPFYLMLTSVFVFPWYEWLGMKYIAASEFNLTFIFLILYIYLSLFLTLPLGYYRVEKVYHVERYISAVFRLIEFVLMVIFVVLGFKVLVVASIYLLMRLINLIYVLFDLGRRFQHFRLFPFVFNYQRIKYLLKPALTIMTISLGQNFIVQGMTNLIGVYLGSAQVVVFNTAKVLVNVAKQMIGIVNLSFFSEFSYAFGSHNKPLLRYLFQRAQYLNLAMSIVGLIGIYLAKDFILHFWLGDKVSITDPFFILLILAMFFNLNWNVSLTLLGATNRQQNIGIYFVLAGMLAVLVNVLFLRTYGLPVVSISIILFELIMLVSVLKYTLNVLEVGMNGYIKLLSSPKVARF